jgi:hypothetical protein
MAVVVFLREPMVDWLNGVDPDNPVWMGSLSERGNVYLIPEFEDLDEAEAHLEEIYDEIFTNELAEWHEDRKIWPQDRTFEMFLEWFDVVYDVAVFDTVGDAGEDTQN